MRLKTLGIETGMSREGEAGNKEGSGAVRVA